MTAKERTDPAGLLHRCAAEVLGSALLVAVGLSFVIFDESRYSPLARHLSSAGGLRALTGFLFGVTGMTIAFSPIGRVSGAHLNPVVSLAFYLERALPGRVLGLYVVSQLFGAALGALPLLAWGSWGSSVSYGITEPGHLGVGVAFLGEVVTTFAMVLLVLSFVGHKAIRAFTPMIFPPLYCLMVLLEAPLSGTSTNPARSLSPDLLLGEFSHYWLYWLAPLVGTALAFVCRRTLPILRSLDVDVAKLAHFESSHWRRRPEDGIAPRRHGRAR